MRISDWSSDVCSSDLIKILRPEGEIDFLSGAGLTAQPSIEHGIDGARIQVETPAEILSKKLRYRGASLAVRDIFDIAAVAERRPAVLDALAPLDTERLARVRDRIERLQPTYAEEAPRVLRVALGFAYLLTTGADVALRAMEKLIDQQNGLLKAVRNGEDRKSTRLNSSH